GAGIIVAFVLAGTFLDVGRGLIDRHHDRASRGIRRLAGVNDARRDVVLFFHEGIWRPRYESRSLRVMRPRNVSLSMTIATRPRSKTSSKSFIFAAGESVSSRSVMAVWTAWLKRSGS